MALKDVKGMNIARVIEYYGNHPVSRDRTFFMYYDEEGGFREVSFGRFLEMSLDYARMIDSLRRRRGRGGDGRFHVGFYMQNTPEVLYAFGGCAFANATLVGINNAQMGQRLATDIKNMDVDVLFVDEIEQPKSGRTFLESVMEAHRDYDLSPLYPRYVIARRRQQRNHPARVATIGEMLEEVAGENFSPTPLEPERAGVIIFTSGTTGTPKGIEVPWKKLFDVGVMSTEISPPEGLARELGLELVARPEKLDSLLPRADFVISAVTLTPETRGSLNRSVFERMKPTAYLINISRGPIVNEEDLLAAVNGGIIAGAGLDVLSSEPPSPTHPLLNHERIVITPHTAGVTEQSFGALGRGVADNISRLKLGRPLINTVET